MIDEKHYKRFWSKVKKTETCWIWESSPHDRYGRFKVGNKNLNAHRISYELHKGKIPDGLQIDHLCRVMKCVNPNHLEAVTCKENIMRGTGKARVNASKTHCKNNHEFTKENTYMYNNGRHCRQCVRDNAVRYYKNGGWLVQQKRQRRNYRLKRNAEKDRA